jgi:G3E family GTPase
VIVNDFGRLNVDASLLNSADTVEMANGCVCCTLADGLPSAFERILALRPPVDAILIEASGVADPGKLAGYAKLAGLESAAVVVVVDAANVRSLARDRFVASEIVRQIRSAGLLVLNKCDTIGGDAVVDVRHWLHGLAPEAAIVEAQHGRVEWPALLSARIAPKRAPDAGEPVHDEAAYESWTFEREGALSQDGLERFVRDLPSHTVRAKGIVALQSQPGRRYSMQWTPNAFAIEQLADWGNAGAASSIVVIGRGAHGLASICDDLARTHLWGDSQ